MNIKTKVKHSRTKLAWNVVGCSIGRKYKVAICPYILVDGDERITTMNKLEALNHADFISNCFNNSKKTKSSIKDSRRFVGHRNPPPPPPKCRLSSW